MEQAKANVCNAMPRANISQIAGKVCTVSVCGPMGRGSWLTALPEQTFLKACIDFSDLCVRSNQPHPVISPSAVDGGWLVALPLQKIL